MKSWPDCGSMVPLGLILLLGSVPAAAEPSSNGSEAVAALRTSGLRPSLSFEPNMGQAGPSVQHRATQAREANGDLGEALACLRRSCARPTAA